jgi:hypothetical protein
MYVIEIVRLCFAKTDVSKKQSSKVQKVVILGSISAFFKNTTYQNKMKNKKLLLMISCWLL